MRTLCCLLLSISIHAGILAAGSVFVSQASHRGRETGMEDRIFVAVLSENELTAQAPSPAAMDATASRVQESRKERQDPKESVAKPEPVEPVDQRKQDDRGEIAPQEETRQARRVLDSDSSLASWETESRAAAALAESPATEQSRPEENAAKGDSSHKASTSSNSLASVPQAASQESRFIVARGHDLAAFKETLLAAIRRRSYFPEKASRRGRLGTAKVRFTVARDGSLAGLELTSSSGSELLDDAAQEIVRMASEEFPPLPGSVAGDSISYEVPIIFKRRERASR